MDEKIKKARNFRNYKLWQDAEGAAKPSDVEFAHFLNTAFGSAFEVETQLLIAKNVGYINDKHNLKITLTIRGRV